MNKSKDTLKNNLNIGLITYNRCDKAINTLMALINSPFSECNITVLNNKSTDNTEEKISRIASEHKNIKLITNQINIGANANILRVFEFSNAKYTWILCDDDFYDFSEIEDIIPVINEGKVDLLIVGGHKTDEWPHSGETKNLRSLVLEKYPYFLFSSFLPSNIFKTDLFIQQINEAYNNIKNSYPHMPYLINMYLYDKHVYISKKRLITPSIGTQHYSVENLIIWWFNTSYYLKDIKDQRLFIISQFNWNNNFTPEMYFVKIAFNAFNLPEHHLRLFLLFPYEYINNLFGKFKRNLIKITKLKK